VIARESMRWTELVVAVLFDVNLRRGQLNNMNNSHHIEWEKTGSCDSERNGAPRRSSEICLS